MASRGIEGFNYFQGNGLHHLSSMISIAVGSFSIFFSWSVSKSSPLNEMGAKLSFKDVRVVHSNSKILIFLMVNEVQD